MDRVGVQKVLRHGQGEAAPLPAAGEGRPGHPSGLPHHVVYYLCASVPDFLLRRREGGKVVGVSGKFYYFSPYPHSPERVVVSK